MRKPKARTGSLFGFYPDMTAEMIYDTSADGQSQPRSFRKRIQFHKTLEYMFFFVRSDAHPCICHGKFDCLTIFVQMLFKKNLTFTGVFESIVDEIGDNLH